ncbi:MAG: hypothetical protein EON48_17440, partial [Acetobacteraceae bacterium]
MAPVGAEVILVTGTDDGYLPLIWVVARSAARRLRPPHRLAFHVLYRGSDAAMVARLQKLRVPNLRVVVHPIDGRLDALQGEGRLPVLTYARLLIPELLPTTSRAIYVDPDVLVREDLGALFDTDLAGRAIGAVPDVPQFLPPRELSHPRFTGTWQAYCEGVLGLPYAPDWLGYVNAGVLLLDLDRLRSLNFSHRTLAWALDMRDRTVWHDQDAINATFCDEITLVDARWNVIPSAIMGPRAGQAPVLDLIDRQRARQAIVHFAGGDKPWKRLTPFAQSWWVTAAFTPAFSAGMSRLATKQAALDIFRSR